MISVKTYLHRYFMLSLVLEITNLNQKMHNGEVKVLYCNKSLGLPTYLDKDQNIKEEKFLHFCYIETRNIMLSEEKIFIQKESLRISIWRNGCKLKNKDSKDNPIDILKIAQFVNKEEISLHFKGADYNGDFTNTLTNSSKDSQNTLIQEYNGGFKLFTKKGGEVSSHIVSKLIISIELSYLRKDNKKRFLEISPETCIWLSFKYSPSEIWNSLQLSPSVSETFTSICESLSQEKYIKDFESFLSGFEYKNKEKNLTAKNVRNYITITFVSVILISVGFVILKPK